MIRALVLCLAVAGCGQTPREGYRDPSAPFSSQANFDAARFAGLWHEIARFPEPSEEGCTAVTSHYAIAGEGAYSVVTSCREGTRDGPERFAEGTARIVGPGRFRIRFGDLPLAGEERWVLWVDADYRTAVIGVPSGTAGWILNREPKIPGDRLRAALEVLDFNGYDVRRIEPTPQPPEERFPSPATPLDPADVIREVSG